MFVNAQSFAGCFPYSLDQKPGFQVSGVRVQKSEDRGRTPAHRSQRVLFRRRTRPRPSSSAQYRFTRTSTRTSTKRIRFDRKHTPCAFSYFPHSNFPGPDLVYKDCLSRWQLLRRSGWVSMIEAVAPGRAESLKPETSYETS
jgi:hypothetical protein